MKKFLLTCAVLGIGILLAELAYACGGSCRPCPDGFSLVRRCCKAAFDKDGYFIVDKDSCTVISNDGRETCEIGYSEIKECCNSDFTECTGGYRACPRCRPNRKR